MPSPLPPFAARINVNARPDAQTEVRIWERFFGGNLPSPGSRKTYFDFYHEELRKQPLGQRLGFQGLGQLAISEHEALLNIADILQAKKRDTRQETHEAVQLLLGFDSMPDAIDRTIDLTVRLCLMIDAKRNHDPPKTLRVSDGQWKDSDSLVKFADNLFPRSTGLFDCRNNKLGLTFTVAFMVDVCRLQVVFTSRLEDHLKLVRAPGTRELHVFPHKSCLFAMMEDPQGQIIPRSVLEETILSLNILFPLEDPATHKLLKKHGYNFHLEEPFDRPRILDLLEAGHWRLRLLELYDEIYATPPTTWTQLLKDTRNPQLYWTFWLAFVIFILTIISTLATLIQTAYTMLGYYHG